MLRKPAFPHPHFAYLPNSPHYLGRPLSAVHTIPITPIQPTNPIPASQLTYSHIYAFINAFPHSHIKRAGANTFCLAPSETRPATLWSKRIHIRIPAFTN